MSGNMYQRQLVNLRGGLDYSSAVLSAPAGALSECLNFETTDYSGYRRIDGFERYDGLVSPSSAFSSSVVTVTQGGLEVADAFSIIGGSSVLNSAGTVIGTVAGADVIDALDAEVLMIVVETYKGVVAAAGALVVSTALGNISLPAPTVTSGSVNLTGTPPTVSMMRSGYASIRNTKRKFPQGRVAHGLHNFKQRSYAVVDFESMLVRQVPNTTTGQEAAGVIVPGDYLDDGTNRVQVLDIQLVSGSWGVGGAGTSATAEAKILYQRVVGDQSTDNVFAADTLLDVIRNGNTTSDVLQVRTALSETARDTWVAGLYKTQITGEEDPSDPELYGYWVPIVHPWEFEYKDGRVTTGLPPTELVKKYRLASFNQEDEPEATEFTPGGTVNEGGGSGDGFYLANSSVLEDDDTNYAFVAASGGGIGAFSAACRADILDFDMSAIPDDAVITGIEAKVVARWNPATTATAFGMGTIGTEVLAVNKPYISGLQILGGNVTGENKGGNTVTIDSDTDQTFTFGGIYDKWGIDDLGTLAVKDPAFGVRIAFARNATSSALAGLDVLDVDQIVLKVYYTQPSTKYYFWNGTDDVSADVIKVHTAKGDWNDDANRPEGTMIVTNVTPVGSATRNNISINDEMYTAPGGSGGSGTLICEVGSNMVVCGLASLSQIVEAKSRYQMITANFYGDESWRAMYGVNGAGRAFSYDGTYFQKIFTGVPVEKDKPRHIRSYKSLSGTNGSIALGFSSGSVQCSVPGEPENFSGQAGAIEVSAASPVVGLATMQGTTLGIFTQDGVFGIKGLGPDSELFSIRPKTGVIEYTVLEVGSDVYYCDVYGIRSISQTDAYGDFTGAPLSSSVSSWLQPRLQKTTDDTQAATPGIIIAGMIVRAKNQIRYFFRDGWVLTMTIKPDGPEFTTQRYAHTTSDVEYVYVPIALCSEVDDNGREILLFSHYADYAPATATINSQDRKRYVFALDKGWSFDGEVIQSYITPYYNFFDGQVFDFHQVNKVRIYGLSRAVASINLYTGKEFEATSTSNAQAMSLTSGEVLQADYVQGTDMANVAKRGICVRLKFEGSTTITEPSYVIQSLLLQYTLSKGDF